MPSSFAITTAANSAPLDGNRKGQTVFTVSNTSVRALRGRAQVVPDKAAAAAWFTLAGGAERDFSVRGTQQYTVQIAVPPTAAAGNYTVRLDMVGVDNPDEDFTPGPSVTIAAPAPSPAKKPFPWWIVAVAAGLLVIAFFVIRSGQENETKQAANATATAVALQQAAQAANATAAAKTAAATNATATAQAQAKLPTVAAKATNGVVTISHVSIDGAGNVAELKPGGTFSMIMDYTIVDPGCPGCIDEIQIGFSTAPPDQCIYQGVPGAAGNSGSQTIQMTAPTTPGTYFIGFDRAQDYSCPTFWWSGAPGVDRYIAAIVVK